MTDQEPEELERALRAANEAANRPVLQVEHLDAMNAARTLAVAYAPALIAEVRRLRERVKDVEAARACQKCASLEKQIGVMSREIADWERWASEREGNP